MVTPGEITSGTSLTKAASHLFLMTLEAIRAMTGKLPLQNLTSAAVELAEVTPAITLALVTSATRRVISLAIALTQATARGDSMAPTEEAVEEVATTLVEEAAEIRR